MFEYFPIGSFTIYEVLWAAAKEINTLDYEEARNSVFFCNPVGDGSPAGLPTCLITRTTLRNKDFVKF